jgi:hypothetical protein
MTTRTGWAVALGVALIAGAACGDDDGVSASFTEPAPGTTIAGSIEFALAAEGVTIEEAGDVHDGAGHFHVIADAGCVDEGDAVPRDVDHVHLGGGQAEGTIVLGPGEHELCVQVADGAHTAMDVTGTLTVDVGIGAEDEWCAVVGEVDERFLEADTSEEDFPVRQALYAGINRLVAQLVDGIDQVDVEAREDVLGALDFASDITAVIVDAADQDEADSGIDAFFGERHDSEFPEAETWILDHCGVAIDD